MTDSPAYTRRQFLHSGLALVSTAATVPAFLGHCGSVMAASHSPLLSSKPGAAEDHVLVVVQLSGGNDGLNTVIPFAMPQYYRARPKLAIPEKDIIKIDTDNGIGLHPAMGDLRDMMQEQIATVVQAVGYPNPNRSHFASMDVWHTGHARGSHGQGWIGKALDADPAIKPALACISIGAQTPLAAQGKTIKPVAFQNAELFRWVGGDLHPALAPAYDALQAVPPTMIQGESVSSFVFRTAMDAQVASTQVRKAVSREPQTSFPASELSRQLQMVAAMIDAQLPTRVYYVAMGGFDTHANQPGQHARLLEQFAQAMRAFYRELKATGNDGRVLSLAFSEFGRRVRQNASGGTDHGTAGPMFLFGPQIRPGLLGKHASLKQLDEGDLIHQIDFRNIYADVLDNWMQVDAAAVLGGQFKPAGIVKIRT